MYINGNLQTLSNRISPYNNTNAVFNNGSFTIGASLLFWNDYNANVRVCYLRIYNKELAQAEVTQNYIWSTKIFYPFFTNPSAPEKITQDLVLDIDAGNLYSYPSSGTKVISPKPNDNPSILRSMIMPLGLSTNYIGGDVEGVLYNGVGFSTNFGGVWNFDGANDYIEFPYNSAVNNADNFTFECWFKSNNIALEQVIFNTNNYGQSPERGYHIEIYQSKMILQVFPSQQFTFSTVTLQSNVWYFLSVTYSNGSINYYVNNVSAGTANHTFIPSSLTLLLGRYRQGSFTLNGQISNLRFYSRVLTEGERKFNYDALSPRFQVQALNNVNYLPAKEMYPDIVQTGLLLNIDPGYYKSYIGSGTTINSLVNNYTGTLNNGVGYLAKNKGQLVFDGTNDYVSIPNADLLNLGNSFTISAWVRINDLVNNLFQSFINTLDITSATKGFTFGWYRDAAYGINGKSIMLQFGVEAFAWNIYSSDTNSITDNNFHHIVVTALNINTNNPTVIFYIDGIQKNTTWWNNSTKRAINYNTDINNIRIGHYYTPSNPAYYNSFSSINLGNIKIYTTILSARDIRQNYLALYDRYNTQIKSGQQLYLDAGNNNSYSGSGTSILDISGNTRNGTLVNGVAFTSNYEGILTFDGTNDYISTDTINLSSTNIVTVSFWAKIENYRQVVGNSNCIIEFSSNYNNTSGGFNISYGDDSAVSFGGVYPITLAIKGNAGYNFATFSKTLVNDLDWHHWVCILDKSQSGLEVSLYIDGILRTPLITFINNNTNNFDNTNLFIGNRAFGNFSLSNIQVYNRALSFSEIQENYTAYATKFGKQGVGFLLGTTGLRNLNTPLPVSIISAENLPSHTFNNMFYDKFDYGLNLTIGDTNFYEFASDYGIQQFGMFNSWIYPIGFNSDPGAKYSFNIGLNSFLDYPGAPITNTASFERNGIYRAPSTPGNKVIAYNVLYPRGTTFFYSGYLKTNLYYETTGLTGIGFGLQGDVKLGYFAVIDVRNGTGETAAFQLRKDINNTVPIATDTAITIQTDRWYRITITWSSAGLITAKLYDGVGPLLSTITVTDTSYTTGYLGITSFSLSSFDNLSNLAAQFTTNAGNIASGESLSNLNYIQPGEVKIYPPSYTTSLITTGEILRLDGANYSGSTIWTDLSASANNGTLTNNPTYTTSNYGAIVFDGVNDFVTLGKDILSTRYTISAWFMLHVQPNNRYQDLFDSQYSGMLMNSGGGQFWYKNVSSYNLPFSFSFKFNTWYQISVVNGANTKSVYVDGDLVASVNDSSNYEPINNFIIGSNNGTSEFLSGKIAHIHAFNRALSSTEIKQNYDALRERYNNSSLFNQFYDQINNGDFFTFGDADYYLPMSEYGPGFGITQLFMPPALATSVVQAGVSGLGLSRVPGYDYKVAAYPAAYVPGSNFFWSGWVKTNPNYITTGHSGIGIGIQPSDKYSGYFAIIDVNNGSGAAASFQLKAGIYNAPIASATGLNITVDTWYRINMYWTTAGLVTAVLYDSYGAELATISSTSYLYSSGYCGLVSYSNSSFDNFTNFQSLRINNVGNITSLESLGLHVVKPGPVFISNVTEKSIVKTNLNLYLDAGKTTSYSGSGNAWNDISGNNNNLSFGSYTTIYDPTDGGGTFVFNGTYEGAITSNPSLNPQYFTLEMWLKFPTVPFSGIPYNKEGLYRLLVSEVFTSTVSTRLGATGWQAYNGVTTVKANTWHHCVATYSGQYVRIYLDGELDAEYLVNGGPSPDNSTSTLHIGAYLPGSYRFFGRISQVRLYSAALLPAQVKQNYEADVQRYGRSYILPKHTLKNLNTTFPTGIISSELLTTTHEFTNLFYEEFETASSLDFGDVVDYTKSETTSEIYGIANYNLPPGINAGATGFGLYWFTMGPLLKPYVKYTGLFGFGMKRIEGGSSNKVLVYKAVYKRSPTFFWSGFVKTYFDYTTTGLSGIGIAIQPNNIYNGYYAVIDVRNGSTPDTASFQLRNGINNTVPLSYISGLALQADKWYRITTSWNTNGVIIAKLYQQTGELIATLTTTDNTYTSGYMGLTSYSNSLFDNFTNIIDNRITNITTIQTAETLGIHKLDPGPVRLYPSNISTLEALGIHFIKPEGNKFLPVSILSSEILTSQFIQPGRVNISPSTFIDANAHGTPRLSPGEVRLFPETFRSLTRFGLHIIKPGIATIFHASLNNQNILGTHILKPGAVNISHQSLNNVNIFGNQKLQPGVVRIYPDTFVVPHLLGSHTVVPGPIFINPNTVESLEALSNANRLYNENKTRPTSIPTAESIGNVNFYLNINTSPQTILSAEALGSHRLRNVNYVNVPTLGEVTVVGTPKFIFVQRFGLLRVFVLTLGSIDTLTGDLGEIGLDVTLLRKIDTEITTIDYIRTVVDNKYIMTIKLDTSGKTPPNI
jgi:hypothetical protein